MSFKTTLLAVLCLPGLVLAADADDKPDPGFNDATFKGLQMRSHG